MGGNPTSVLVVLDTADESEVPLEVCSQVDAAAGDDLRQTVCSFAPPADETFGLAVTSLDGRHRLDVGAYYRLSKLLRETDVVHVHSNVVAAVTRLLATVHGVDIVSSEHNTHTDFGALRNLLNGGTNWLSDAVVAVSEAVAGSFGRWEDALLAFGGTEKTVIQNGVDVAAVQAAADRPLPFPLPEGFLIGSGGRMVPQKNLQTVIEAVATLREDHPDVTLILTGDGPRRESLERLAVELDVADDVLFTGFLERRADVLALYHRLDAFTLPSRHEGWGVAVGEAMAAGVPVVVSETPALREVVGDAGLVVDHDDPDALAARLTTLYEDPDRSASLGAAGRERITDAFPIERTAEEHLGLYRAVADGGD